MMHSAFAPALLPGNPQAATAGKEYEPGICKIGPAEVARRLRAGHVGLVATLGLYTGLTMIGAPRLARLLVALPAAGAASGYLQARLQFCAGFGSRASSTSVRSARPSSWRMRTPARGIDREPPRSAWRASESAWPPASWPWSCRDDDDRQPCGRREPARR